MEKSQKSEERTYDEDWLVFCTTIGLDDPFHDVRTMWKLYLHNKTEENSEAEFAESPDCEAKAKKSFAEVRGET